MDSCLTQRPLRWAILLLLLAAGYWLLPIPGQVLLVGDDWLATALAVANEEPQIAALCWFVDYFPHDDQWAFFSLTNPRGQMVNAAAEFERLLRE